MEKDDGTFDEWAANAAKASPSEAAKAMAEELGRALEGADEAIAWEEAQGQEQAKAKDAWRAMRATSPKLPPVRRRRRRAKPGRPPGPAYGPVRTVILRVDDALWAKARRAVMVKRLWPTLGAFADAAFRAALAGFETEGK